MLEKTMDELGARSPTVFTLLPASDGGVKVSIKLDVSSLTSVSGERITLSVVEGDSYLDGPGAEYSAVMKAFSHLEKNHLVRLVDFSSHVACTLQSSNTYDLFIEANGCL